MDIYNINSAISQGNALTQSTDQYNETINKARDDIKNYYQNRLDGDQSKQTEDDYIYGAQDLYSTVVTGFKSTGFKDAYKDFDDSDSIGDFFGRQFERGRADNPLFYKLGGLTGTGLGKVAKVSAKGLGSAGSGIVGLGGRVAGGIRDSLDPASLATRDLNVQAVSEGREIVQPEVQQEPAPVEAEQPAGAEEAPDGAEEEADPRVSRALNDNSNGADAGDGNGAPVRPDERPTPPANQLEDQTLRASQGTGGQVSRGVAQVNEPETALQRRDRLQAERAGTVNQEGEAQDEQRVRPTNVPDEDNPLPAPPAPAPAPAPLAPSAPADTPAPSAPTDIGGVPTPPIETPSNLSGVPTPNIPEEGGDKTLFQSLKDFKDSAGVKTAGKITGNIAGGLDIYDYFKQGDKFKEDNNFETWGDRLTAMGTVMDVVGTVNPLLETIGAISSFAGTVASTIGQHEADVKKQTITDPANETQELSQLTTKVSPSFQALGQVASQNNHVQAQSGFSAF